MKERVLHCQRFLIFQREERTFLKKLEEGRPVWTNDVLEAMRHCDQSVAQRNISALEALLGEESYCEVREQAFYLKASRPSQVSVTPF